MLVKMRKNERCSWNAAKYIALFLVLPWFDFNDDDYDRMIHIKRLSLWLVHQSFLFYSDLLQ